MNTSVNLEYYRIFYTIAAYGSISAAAGILHNSQPNLTRSMKNLESALGCTLMIRTNRGITLTSAGKTLYEHLQVAFAQIERGEQAIEASKQVDSGILNIAVTEVALRCFLLPVLKTFRSLYPHIHLRIGNHLTFQAIDSVRDGSADFAVVTVPDNIDINTFETMGLMFTCLRLINEVCVCSREFEKSVPSVLTLSDAEKLPLICLSHNTVTAASYRKYFADYGCSFRPTVEAATADQILPLVKANLGIAFVPDSFAENDPEIVQINTSVPLPKRRLYAVTQKSRALTPAAEKFMAQIR